MRGAGHLSSGALLGVIGAWLAFSPVPAGTARIDKPTYHNDAQRTGWNARETRLTPRTVSGPPFGPMWRTPQFDSYNGRPPRLFAAPLYLDKVDVSAGRRRKAELAVIYAVTTTGYVYAVNAFAAGDRLPGAILWRARLTDKPCFNGVFGNLSTPVIDRKKQRLYVTSCDSDAQWRAHALDVRSGAPVGGWPVRIDHAAVNAPGVNRNGSTQFPDKIEFFQRGALNLAPDGSRLYVTFGAGAGFANGWVIAVDTVQAKVATAFSATGVKEERQGGIWSSGGPSIDAQGRVYAVTGANSANLTTNLGIKGIFPDSPHNWGQSIIQLEDDPKTGFKLAGTYTPFNYCQTAAMDIDLGSSSAIVIDLDPAITRTPQLLALGGTKQGNAYLLDRTHLPGSLIRRQACSEDPTSDRSLLAPDIQPQFGRRGPISVFDPYTDRYGLENQAKSRTTAAYFRDQSGVSYLFVTGSAKTGEDLAVSTPPGLARLKIVTQRDAPAYLRIDQLERSQTFHNPGSPIVTSNGGRDAIVWVLDGNALRTANLYGPNPPQPILYAFDALTFKLLWKSAPGQLSTSGRYNEPTVVRGMVFVGTDRIEAFGLGGPTRAADPGMPAGMRTSAASIQEADFEPIDGAGLFSQRCAMCHGSGMAGVPTRDALSLLSHDKIVDTLVNGAMQNQAFGLSTEQIDALATYLTTKIQPAARPIADVTPQRLLNVDAEPDAWLTGGRDYRQSYYSPLTDIDKTNVRKLGFAWAHDIDYYDRFEATPLVVDGVMFTSGISGAVYALDARTGAGRWTFKPEGVDLKTLYAKSCCGAVNRGVAVWRGKVYVASFDGHLYALDAGNGAVVWKADTIVDRSRGYTSTGAPYIAQDKVVIGNSGADLDARGYITAYDAQSGRQAWRFFTVPGDPAQGFEHPELQMAAKTWDPGSRWDVGLGGTAWDGMAYDPTLNLLYVGTGNAAPWPRKQRSPSGGDNLFLSSILAIDPGTGRLVWYYQTTPADNWDYTATQKMILAELRIGGKPRQVIMQAPKNGFFYVLDRRTGELLSAKPFVKVTWASHVDLKSGRPVETGQGDYSGGPRLVFPGAWGGHSWPPMAYNDKTGLVYIPAFDIPMVFKMPEAPFKKGQLNMAIHIPMTSAGTLPAGRPETGLLPPIEAMGAGQPDRRSRTYLKAWDPVKQRVVWQVETSSDAEGFVGVVHGGGVMTTAGGLVFQGRKSGQLAALDAATGTQLHSIQVGSAMTAAPMTYKIDGEQYVAIMSSDARSAAAVGHIIAFKLGGGAVPGAEKTAADTGSAAYPLPPVASTGTAQHITLGGTLFERHCAVCHATGRAPDLSRMNAQTHREFMDIVLHGLRAEKGMGNFSGMLSAVEAQAIHDYLTSLAWENYNRAVSDKAAHAPQH